MWIRWKGWPLTKVLLLTLVEREMMQVTIFHHSLVFTHNVYRMFLKIKRLMLSLGSGIEFLQSLKPFWFCWKIVIWSIDFRETSSVFLMFFSRFIMSLCGKIFGFVGKLFVCDNVLWVLWPIDWLVVCWETSSVWMSISRFCVAKTLHFFEQMSYERLWKRLYAMTRRKGRSTKKL